jgi:predicted nucleic acid-binding Zn ribbon protein
METTTPTATPAAPAVGPTHGCVRCGAPVPLDIAMCERCNPLGLPQPASSQAHGTVFLAIALSVVGLALLGRFALSGIGPFSGSIVGLVPAPPGLAITLSVTNGGSSAGSTTCRVFDPSQPGLGADSAFLTSPAVEPGQTIAFSGETSVLGSQVRPLAVECGRQ